MAAPVPRSFLAGVNPLAPLRQLAARRELLWQFTVRYFQQRHKGSHLGLAWAVLNPLLMLGLYYVVFGLILGGHFRMESGETKADYALALLVGLTLFHLLTEVINQAPGLITANPNLVKKVVFPVEVIPVASLGASLVHFGISLAIVVAGQGFVGTGGLSAGALWLPAIILPVVLMAAGVAWSLAAFGVFLRDIAQTTQFFSLVLMYVSAVFIPARLMQQIPALWAVLRFNPVLQAIEMTRESVLWHQPLNLAHLGWLYAAGLAVFALGHACFAWLRPSFADVL